MASARVSITGVVAALRAEARCAGGALLVRRSGIGSVRAAEAARELLAAGAQALLCFGVGGALEARLRCGDIVVASEVVSETGVCFATDARWRRQLEQALAPVGRVAVGRLLTQAELVCQPAAKRALLGRTGALAVDMESAAVAAVAAAAQVPLMALRVIADTAADELPAALRRALALGASERALWWAVLSSPRSWGAAGALARRYRRAQRVLERCARAGVARGPPDAVAAP